ncbi:MAG: hypothetical protein ABSF95_19190, partial [Verrucomicrobiota bacterium]
EGVEETFGMAWRLFATMLERAETTEAVGLNWARLHSTRPPPRPAPAARPAGDRWVSDFMGNGRSGYFLAGAMNLLFLPCLC